MTQKIDESIIEQLVSQMKEANVDDDALDEYIYELYLEEVTENALNATDNAVQQKQIIKQAEKRASSINNEGQTAQLRKLLKECDYDYVVNLVSEACDNSSTLKC